MMLMLNVRMLVGCGVVRPPGCRTITQYSKGWTSAGTTSPSH